MNNIYLTGFMGTGKSTVAKALQEFIPFQIIEMDSTIETMGEMSINEIFEKYGEDFFRNSETRLLKLISEADHQIVSTGGGIVLRNENTDIMKKSGTVIWLRATAKSVYERVTKDETRPLLKNRKSVEDIQSMMDQRLEAYANASEITVDVDDKNPVEIASEIVTQLALLDRLK